MYFYAKYYVYGNKHAITDKNIERMRLCASHCSSWLWNRQNESAATRHEVETQTDARSCIDVVHNLQSDALSKIEKKLHLKTTALLTNINIFEYIKVIGNY